MKYQIGQPLVCYKYDNEGDFTIPILGCIIDVAEDNDKFMYYVEWADGEEDCYMESWLEKYVKQATF